MHCDYLLRAPKKNQVRPLSATKLLQSVMLQNTITISGKSFINLHTEKLRSFITWRCVKGDGNPKFRGNAGIVLTGKAASYP